MSVTRTTNPRRLWLLLILMLIGIGAAYWFMQLSVSRGPAVPGSASAEARAGDAPEETDAASFADLAERMQPPAACTLDAEAIADGLRRLAAVLGTAGVASDDLMVAIRASAEHVLLNPDSPEVAATVRQRLTDAAAALAPAGDAAVRQAAAGIDEGAALTAQSPALCTFFVSANDALGARARGEK